MFLKFFKLMFAVSLFGPGTLFSVFIDAQSATTSTEFSTTSTPICSSLGPATKIETEPGSFLGAIKNSGITYSFDDAKFNQRLNISVDIKTREENGIIFYVTSPDEQDFFGIYLKNSKLHFTYRCDGSDTSYSAGVDVNNGTWRNIQLTSDVNRTQLTIDDSYRGRTSGCKRMNIVSPYYIGAVIPKMMEMVKNNLEGINTPLIGCVKNIKSDGSLLDNLSKSEVLTPCLVNVESGAYFSSGNSYLLVDKHFTVGRDIMIEMTIKTSNANGLLAAVHSTKDFIVLQLVNGQVKFTVENGNGPITTSFQPINSSYFCDNSWHRIAALKRKNVIVLNVDDNPVPPDLDWGSDLITNTADPFYIGGRPTSEAKLRGVESNIQFIGCIKNVHINGNELDILSSAPYGNVAFNSCPVNAQ